jgi:hypothetical protein
MKNIYCEPNVSGGVTPLGTKPTSAKVSDPILKQLQKLDFRLRQSTVICRF